MINKKKFLTMTLISLVLSSFVQAEILLDPVKSSSLELDKGNLGKVKLGEKDLSSRLGLTNDINGIFKFLSNIQFVTDDTLDGKSGQIEGVKKHLDQRPAEFSISGGKPYENQFVIGGASGNSKLAPAVRGSLGDDLSIMNSGNSRVNNDISESVRSSQQIWVDRQVVDSISVYDSNVPVKYTDFSGGVVDAKLKKAKDKSFGTAYMDYSSSSLSQYTIHIEKETASKPKKPVFEKIGYGVSYNRAVNSKVNMLYAFSGSDTVENSGTKESKSGKVYKNQSHLNKHSIVMNSSETNTSEWDFSLLMHDYKYQNYQPDNSYPEFNDDKNTGLQMGGSITNDFKGGELRVALSQSINTMDKKSSGDNYFLWSHKAGDASYFTNDLCNGLDKNGDLCIVGGAGERTEKQDSKTLAVSYTKPWSEFEVTYGANITNNKLSSNRARDHMKYMDYSSNDTDYHPAYGKLTDAKGTLGTNSDQDLSKIANINKAMYIGSKVKCTDEATTAGYCKAGKQSLYIRERFNKGVKSATYTDFGGYVQLATKMGSGKFTGGLRIDVDKGTGNNPIAPRMSYLIEKKGATWNFGVNRYYKLYNAANKLASFYGYNTQYLRPDKVDADGTTTYGNDWRDDDSSATGASANEIAGLKNPYTDEFSIGYQSGTKADGQVRVKGIIRHGKDEFAQEQGYDKDWNATHTLTNNGVTDHKSLSFDFVKKVSNSLFSIGTTFSSLDTNNVSVLLTARKKKVGKEVLLTDRGVSSVTTEEKIAISRRKFSKPTTINFSVISNWYGGNLTTYLVGKYSPNYTAIIKNNGNIEYKGKWYSDYRVNHITDHVVLDLKTKYKLPVNMVGNKNVTFNLSVNNILRKPVPRGNEAIATNYITNDISVFLGLEYKF